MGSNRGEYFIPKPRLDVTKMNFINTPFAWNKLTLEVRNISNLDKFKLTVKKLVCTANNTSNPIDSNHNQKHGSLHPGVWALYSHFT